ncbi:NtaA/DmoA family FMN-dependent monooxygenase [Pelagibacterium lacus]|nr:NtaA/DmoA family FMN-dependent monooxygenase [Pelagibacterium lacus]
MKRIRLALFLSGSVTQHSLGSWRHPLSASQHNRSPWDRVPFWLDIARSAERGGYDLIFFSDSNGMNLGHADRHDDAVRYAAQAPRLDPLQILPAMAAVTSRIGLAATQSVLAVPPFVGARAWATLDHLSGGRAGWNVVAGYLKSEGQNLGYDDLLAHDERYAYAGEYIEVCNRLWQSWDEDAIVSDTAGSTFADPTKVREINFAGKWFRSRGPAQVHRSPQGRPLIIQAGQSPAGRAFGAQNADVIFAICRSAAQMKSFRDDMRKRAVEAGRDPDRIKILFGMQPIVGETDEIARQKAAFHQSLVPLEAGIFYLSGHLGVDLSGEDPDRPLRAIDVPGVQGILDAYADTSGDGAALTVGEAAQRHAGSVGFPQVVGSPERVARWMLDMMEEAGGDGFMISPIHLPGSADEFGNLVIPILEREAGRSALDLAGPTLRERMMEE